MLRNKLNENVVRNLASTRTLKGYEKRGSKLSRIKLKNNDSNRKKNYFELAGARVIKGENDVNDDGCQLRGAVFCHYIFVVEKI